MKSFDVFTILRTYIEMGFLIFFGYLVFSGILRIFAFFKTEPDHSSFVRIGYGLLLTSVLLPLLLLTLPRSSLLRPSAQVWSESQPGPANPPLFLSFQTASAKLTQTTQKGISISEKALTAALFVICMTNLGLFALFTRKLFKFHRELNTLPLVKKIGKVRILTSSDHSIGFSTWLPGRAIVVVPFAELIQRENYRMIVQHEIQHHRHGDTQWLFLTEFLRTLFFWNPGVYRFSRKLSQLQEFACDAFLIGRRKWSSRAYGSCLIRAAESSIGSPPIWAGTTQMATVNDPSLLMRRINMILDHKPNRPEKVLSAWISLCLIGLMTSVAYAAKSSVQDRALRLEEAQKYALVAMKESEIPIIVNDLVLDKINYFIGTSEGRQWVKEGLTRMSSFQEMIFRKFSETTEPQIPKNLIAMALYESGFKNLPPTPPQRGAGIWEFITPTARKYNLKVSEQVDERLDPEKETDAAVRYLKDLYQRFGDWRLAIKAYNEGEVRVEKLIKKTGSRDPWVLERNSSPDGYLSGTMAMMILMNNPSLLN